LGNPGMTVQEADIQYSRFNLVMELRRNVLNFITRNLLPVFFIILLSYFSFYLPEIDFEALIPILTGTVLSIVFFHLDVSNDLGVSYTVMLDYVFYIMYAMFVFQLLLSLIAWRTETVRLQKAIMFVVKLSYPLVVLITVTAFLYRYTDFWQTNFAFLWSREQTAAQQIAQGAPAPTTTDQVTLRLGSWRLQEEAAMNRLLTVFHSQQPTITVQWEGITPDNYTDILWRQLEKGVAPDFFYVPSFSGGQRLWQANHLAALNDLPELQQNFTAKELAPWATTDGIPYGAPFIATAYGIYYNVDLFQQLNLTPPTTWEVLLQTAQTLQKAGHLPFANGIQEGWTVNEMIFMNLAPNFIGGQAGRLAYLTGKRCFNDANSVAAFQALADLAPFLPPDKETLNFADSRQLFLDGKAAMLMADSRELPALEAGAVAFDWSVLAMPAPAGQPTVMTYIPTTALALNAASAHPTEARIFLAWLATPETEALISKELPGLFTPHSKIPPSPNPRAQAFLTLLGKHETDIGWAWQEVSNKTPAGYGLMQASAIGVITGAKSAQEAADDLQNGLAQWFQPAQRCLLGR
jgi:raffinose/stachyose/melibiose transport system substrate-binding protein